MAKRTVGELVTLVTAKVSPYEKGMRKVRSTTKDTEAQAKKSAKGMETFGRSLTKVGVIAVGAMAGIRSIQGLFSSLTESFADLDKLAKTADKLGVLPEELQKLQFAVGQTAGKDAAALNIALQRMTRRVSQAADGTGEARKAIEELGLSAQMLNAMSPDKQFLQIADAMSKVDNQADRVRLTFSLFDSEGVDLVNTLSKGSREIERLGTQLEKRGGLVTREELARIEASNDAMDKMNRSMEAMNTSLSVGLAPALEDFFETVDAGAQTVNVLRNNFDDLKTAMSDMVEFANRFVFEEFFHFFEVRLPSAIDTTIKRFASIRGLSEFATNPIGATVDAAGDFGKSIRDANRDQLTDREKFLLSRIGKGSREIVGSVMDIASGDVPALANAGRFQNPQTLSDRFNAVGEMMPPWAKRFAEDMGRGIAAKHGAEKVIGFGGALGMVGQGIGSRFMADIQMAMGQIAATEFGPNSAVLKGSSEAARLEAERNRPEVVIQERQLEQLEMIAAGVTALAGGGETVGMSIAGAFEGIF